MRHGPHHVAQESTIMNSSCFSTSGWKSASWTAMTFDMNAPVMSIDVLHNLNRMQSPSHRSETTGATIAHVGIAVRGLDDSVSFYRDVLGMETVPMNDSDGARIAAFAAGPSPVELLEPQAAESPIGKLIDKRT